MARTLPVGGHLTPDNPNDRTKCAVAKTIGSADTLASAVFNSGVIRRIWCNASGTLSVSRVGDFNDDATMAFTAYTMTASSFIDGQFQAIGGTSNSVASTAIAIVMEQ